MIPNSIPGSVTLHARHHHGGYPVLVRESLPDPHYEVRWPHGPVAYDSARQLLRALYNSGDVSPEARDPGMTFDRYFRLGSWAEPDDGPTVLDLFGDGGRKSPAPIKLKRAPAVVRPATARRRSRVHNIATAATAATAATLTTLSFFGSVEIAEAKIEQPALIEMRWADRYAPAPAPAPAPVTVARTNRTRPARTGLSVAPDPQLELGIDLVNRSHEVKKLLFAGFGAKIVRAGYDPEDVLQEVYRGLLARNKGTCPWDARISSFGHYVHMVCGCVLANYHRKYSRQAEFEQVGMITYQGSDTDDFGGRDDAALAATSNAGMFSDNLTTDFAAGESQALLSLLGSLRNQGINPDGSLRPEASLAMEALPLVYEGYTRSEIARELSTDPSKVGRSLAYLRRVAAGWRSEAV